MFNIDDLKLFEVKAWISRGPRKEIIQYWLPATNESELRKFMAKYIRAEYCGYRIYDLIIRCVEERSTWRKSSV